MKNLILFFLFFQLSLATAIAQQYKYHIVKEGETLYQIAQRYNTSVETIYTYNPDARSGISPGNKLVVPVNGTNEQIRETTGVKFKTHRVRRRETLFSLSQQYQVPIEQIKKYNKHLYSEELRRGEKIRIPINLKPEEPREEPEGVNPLDLSAKEHLVLPKETWFGISRKYNITIEDLKGLNPGVTILKPGMVLKVRNGNTQPVIPVEGSLFTYYQVKPQETLYSLTRRFGISRDSLVTLNPALQDGLKSGMVLKVPNPENFEVANYSEEHIVNLEHRISNRSTKDLVVMLPFNLHRIDPEDTTTTMAQTIRNDKVMQISLDFYSGVLMAVDSAKSQGISTNLRVFDTHQSAAEVRNIINTHDFSEVEAVIGPVLQDQAEAAAAALEQQQVPVISPLTKKKVGGMSNFLQTRPTDEMLTEGMISFLSENAAGKNIVVITDPGAANTKQQLLHALPQARTIDVGGGSNVSQKVILSSLVKDRPNWVVLESSQIGVLSNVVSYLNSLLGPYKITLLTTQKNKHFESDNVSNYHLGNLRFHYPSVERSYEGGSPTSSLIRKYREKYGVTPNTYAVRGFDVTYDILLRLASSRDLMTSLEEEGTTQYLENKFDYEKQPAGGYQNTAHYILFLDKGLTIKQAR